MAIGLSSLNGVREEHAPLEPVPRADALIWLKAKLTPI